MINEKTIIELFEKIHAKDVYSVELTWIEVGNENIPYPVIKVVKGCPVCGNKTYDGFEAIDKGE